MHTRWVVEIKDEKMLKQINLMGKASFLIRISRRFPFNWSQMRNFDGDEQLNYTREKICHETWTCIALDFLFAQNLLFTHKLMHISKIEISWSIASTQFMTARLHHVEFCVVLMLPINSWQKFLIEFCCVKFCTTSMKFIYKLLPVICMTLHSLTKLSVRRGTRKQRPFVLQELKSSVF